MLLGARSTAADPALAGLAGVMSGECLIWRLETSQTRLSTSTGTHVPERTVLVQYEYHDMIIPYRYEYGTRTLLPGSHPHPYPTDQSSKDRVTNAFVLRCASRAACIFRLSPLRGLPQDMAVPSRYPRRESPEKVQILKTVSYDFSRITITEQSRYDMGRQRIYG